MSDTSQNATEGQHTAPADWRRQIKELGKQEFERREMERLGFWPPSAEEIARYAAEHAQVEELRARLPQINEELRAVADAAAPLRQRIGEVKTEIATAGDVKQALAEARHKRIERVKQERAERKLRKAQERIEKQEKDKQWRSKTLPHLGRGVSKGLRFETPSDETKLAAHNLPVLHHAEDVAKLLSISTGQLAWLTYHREAAPLDHYRHFSIPKKSGGLRAISAPRPHLKQAQETLLRQILDPVPVHEAAMAFRPKTHIGHNAARHAHFENGGAAVLLKIDLKDFFPSITFKRVKGVFGTLGYNEGVATLCALICTEAPRIEAEFEGQKYFVAVTDRFLPQGAPSSPAITNIMCRRLDARLGGLARHHGFTYTRYADDLIFSSPDPKAKVLSLRDGARHIIENEKFTINEKKLDIMRRGGRQSVTGLVINALNHDGTPRLSRRDLRRFRAFLHDYEKRGREALTLDKGQDALSYARGYLSYIHMVNPAQASRLLAAHPWLIVTPNKATLNETA